jgi:hypothetical protein
MYYQTHKPPEKIPMINKSDISRPHRVKADFDQNFNVTPHGGAALVEQVMRSLGVLRMIGDHLPSRSPSCQYSMKEAVYALIVALLVGGRGIGATDILSISESLPEIFGLEKGVPSAPTMYRVLCELAGIEERPWDKTYKKAGRVQTRMELGGRERPATAYRRIVPESPESALDESRKALRDFLLAVSKRCAKAIRRSMMTLHGWYVVFGDGTDLEVEGNCFDAARMGRMGEKIFRLMMLMLGPIVMGHDLLPGNADEGKCLPGLIERTRKAIREIAGRMAKILALLDAAFFEKAVIDEIEKSGWDFIVCANQQRDSLQRLAEEQPEMVWKETGPDANRGWRRSQVCAFAHTPSGWERPVTIVCRRFENEGEITGAWNYSFLATRIEKNELPKKLQAGYAEAVFMLYGTKQGRENHLKTPLCDLNLHHPPSCRLGVNEAIYAIGLAASNIAMAMRYRVIAGEYVGMHLWRMRKILFQIAGYLKRGGRTLQVWLSGGDTPIWRQTLWLKAYAEAGRL